MIGVLLFGNRPEIPLAWMLGTFFLFAFYRSIRSKWPENYFAFDSPTDPIVSKSLVHYLAYRMVPVHVTCLFVGVSLDRSGLRSLNGWSAAVRGVVGVAFGHAMLTNGRGMATVLKRRLRGTRDVGVVVLQSAVFVAILSAGLLSLLGRSVLAPLVPRSSDLSVALWTGIVVAAMGGWLIDATRGEIKHAERLAKSSHKSLDKALLAFAQKRCAETGTEWNFFLAVMLVENLQRPPWVRRLERSASRLRSQGTYGVMQVLSAEPISDTESVDLALGRHLGGFSVPSDPDVHGWAVISEKLRTYNGSEEYANQVCEIYQSLEDGSLRFK